MATMQVNPMSLGERKRPTKKHKAAVWEGILGAVYAADPAGNVRYFDMDWNAALEYAQVDGEDADLRVYRYKQGRDRVGVRVGPYGTDGPRNGQLVLWRAV